MNAATVTSPTETAMFPSGLYAWFHGLRGPAHVYRKPAANAEPRLLSACGIERLPYDTLGRGNRKRCPACQRAAGHWRTQP